MTDLRPGAWPSAGLGPFVREHRDDVVDVAVFLLVLTVVVTDALNGLNNGVPASRVLVTGAVTAVPLLGRRRYPLGSLVAVLVLSLAQLAVFGTIQGHGIFYAVLVATFSLAAHTPLRRALVGLGALAVVLALARILDESGSLGDLEDSAAYVVGFLLAGHLLWTRQEQVEQISEQSAERDRRRVVEARAVVVEDGRRVARELQDTIAHQVTDVLGAVDRAQEALPDAAAAGRELHTIKDVSTQTLAQLDRLVAVLGDSDPARRPVQLPAPQLRDAARLVGQLRSAGLDVRLRLEVGTGDVPADVDLAAYRVLQEALFHSWQHAGNVKVEACVQLEAGAVVVEVVEVASRRGLRAGVPDRDRDQVELIDLRSQLALRGGELEAGPVDEGFRVRARIPVRHV